VVEGATTAAIFEAYHVEEVLALSLHSERGRGLVVMDNLTAHKGERVRENWSSSGDASYSVPAALPSLLS